MRSRCDREARDLLGGLFESGLGSFVESAPGEAQVEALVEVLCRLEPGMQQDLSGISGLGRDGEDLGQIVAAAAAIAQRRWQRGELDFDGGVALFVGLERLLRFEGRKDRFGGGRVLLLVPEGEEHLLGPRLVRRELVAAGCDVTLEIGATPERWLGHVATEVFDVVGLSFGHDELLAEARDWIDGIRAASCHAGVSIMVGGAALTAAQEAYRFLGADLVTCDLAVATSFLKGGRVRPGKAN